MKRFIYILICAISIISLTATVHADDFVPADEVSSTENISYTIDSADSATDSINLQFGVSVGQYLSWDIPNDRFELSDDLRIEGNNSVVGQIFIADDHAAALSQGILNIGRTASTWENLTFNSSSLRFDLSDDLRIDGNLDLGTELVLDAANTGAGTDSRIIANQGTDNDGEIRYNATTDKWELSNDGNAFDPIAVATGDEEYFDAYNTVSTNVSGGFTDIPLNTERKKTTAFTHAVNSAEVTIGTTGTYIVTLAVTTDISAGTARSESEMRLMLDPGGGGSFAPVTGSIGRMYNRTAAQGESTATRTIVLDLTAGDILKVQASRISGTDTIVTVNGGSSLTIVRTAGIGQQGPQGPSGSNGAGWTENGAQTETLLNVDVSGTGQFDGDINGRCGPHGVFWAERGTIGSNASWALGNGQTPFGSPMGCAGRVRRFAATCTGTIGTSLGAEIRINNVAAACNLNLSTTVGQVTAVDCDIPFTATDVVGVYAQTEVGAWTECVGTFWVRYD